MGGEGGREWFTNEPENQNEINKNDVVCIIVLCHYLCDVRVCVVFFVFFWGGGVEANFCLSSG